MFTNLARRPLLLRFFSAVGLLAIAAAAAHADDKPSPLPLKKVVLFNSGVGFFEHRAEVEGDAKVELKFNVGDINDLLKSMVVQDLGGGQISTVTYGSKDPITKTLKTFAIDLTNNPTLARSAQAGPRRAGRDRSAQQDHRHDPGRRDPQEGGRRERSGRDRVAQPADRRGPAEPCRWTASAASSWPTKSSTPSCGRPWPCWRWATPPTRRPSRSISRARASGPCAWATSRRRPIWKTSYRLVLGDKEAPFLQGWAIVENTTEEDWNGRAR